MQKREDIKQLLERYAAGQASPEEQERLHGWLNRYAEHEAVGLDELKESFEAKQGAGRWRLFRCLPYAAAVASIAFAMIWYFKEDFAIKHQSEIVNLKSDDRGPGGNRATLTLADGRKMDLSEAQSGIVVGDERILYEDGTEELINLQSANAIPLVLSTPMGGTYQITLSDGTKIQLNAASTLKYPSQFAREKRVVEIDGEGYFEVAKDSTRPFTVISKGQEIEVLGTIFNISAYQDEAEVKTTLVEGSVRLQVGINGEQVLLKPGEQSIMSGNSIIKHFVDTESYIAWKEGTFHFSNTPISDVLTQVSRWYGVEVIYENQVPKELLTGTMSRSVTLQTVLELLRISEIKCRMEGNKLIIG